ncbi:uncharacterized protein LOC143277058 isoform X2 [Babylonia areolata]|uniref:uncharacterized protein LOC143277058 isoform X2 n=1 Tax=Babylonia areolata TaxID=304850 RepID=UPI003FD60A00
MTVSARCPHNSMTVSARCPHNSTTVSARCPHNSMMVLIVLLAVLVWPSSAQDHCSFSGEVKVKDQRVVLTCWCQVRQCGSCLMVVQKIDITHDATPLHLTQVLSDQTSPPSKVVLQKAYNYTFKSSPLIATSSSILKFKCITHGLDHSHNNKDKTYYQQFNLTDLFPAPITTVGSTSTSAPVTTKTLTTEDTSQQFLSTDTWAMTVTEAATPTPATPSLTRTRTATASEQGPERLGEGLDKLEVPMTTLIMSVVCIVLVVLVVSLCTYLVDTGDKGKVHRRPPEPRPCVRADIPTTGNSYIFQIIRSLACLRTNAISMTTWTLLAAMTQLTQKVPQRMREHNYRT